MTGSFAKWTPHGPANGDEHAVSGQADCAIRSPSLWADPADNIHLHLNCPSVETVSEHDMYGSFTYHV